MSEKPPVFNIITNMTAVIYLDKWALIACVVGRNMGMWGVDASFGSFA